MVILSSRQLKEWDQYTLEKQKISSLDLMEKAAKSCFNWLMEHDYGHSKFSFFCGKGNNGGDGLALARLLSEIGLHVTVYILEFGNKGSQDFQSNLQRVHHSKVDLKYITNHETIPQIPYDHVIIDALWGTGLNRIVEGLSADLICHLNESGRPIISLDIPSGLFSDCFTPGAAIIKATQTLSFQALKFTFLFAYSHPYTGNLSILNIGLEEDFPGKINLNFHNIDLLFLKSFFKRRKPFSHKGDFGHACIVTGKSNMLGAGLMASKSCLRSGAGKLSVLTEQRHSYIFQSTLPEAMLKFQEDITSLESDSFAAFDCIAIGPGLGQSSYSKELLQSVLNSCSGQKIIVDADAINLLSSHPEIQLSNSNQFVLTPHPKEADRLLGACTDEFNRLEKAKAYCIKTGAVMVLKGRYTFVINHSGAVYVNFTGNPGLSKGGSGDVLTGMITGIAAQGYHLFESACLAVYLHGKSADLCRSEQSEESMLSTDVIKFIGRAFMELY